MRIFFIALIALLCFKTFSADAQSIEQIKTSIDNEVLNLKKGNFFQTSIFHFDSINEKVLLNYLAKYETEPLLKVKFRISGLIFQIGLSSSDSSVRKQAVEELLTIAKNSDFAMQDDISEKLSYFHNRDYSSKAKGLMIELFSSNKYSNKFLLACGIAELNEIKPQIKLLADNFSRIKENCFISIEWYACLAITRMGATEKIDNIISAIELELNPNIRIQTLLIHAAYTQNIDCLQLLEKYLFSTEKIPGYDGRPGIEYSKFALDYLVKYVDDFSIGIKSSSVNEYTDEQIMAAQRYLAFYIKDKRNNN